MTNWKTKALTATEGSRFGAILAAALGETIPRHATRLSILRRPTKRIRLTVAEKMQRKIFGVNEHVFGRWQCDKGKITNVSPLSGGSNPNPKLNKRTKS